MKFGNKITCLLTASIPFALFAADNKPQKPNIVIIYADDIGYGDIACNGYQTIRTPNIDQLAKQGVRFTNLHSTAAQCTPSRYALLTGEYAWRREGTGIAAGNAGSIIRPERYTLADLFKNIGYQTGVIGKWHLGLGDKTATQDWNGHITPGPSDLGFNYSYIMAATGDRVPCVYVENEHVVNLDPKDPIYVSYETNFDGEPTGKANPELLKIHPSHGHDQSIVNGISRIGFMKGGKSALWKDEDMADVITGKALEFIEKNKSNPFFLYFATQDAHVPRVPHPRFAGQSGMGPRGDAIVEFDWTVGEVLKALKKLGLEKNTIVILSSDNGPVVDDGYKDRAVELLGTHKPAGDFRGGKYSSFEGGTRVPAILSWPGNVKPGVSGKLLCQVDMIASFASLLNVELPAGVAPDSENHLSEWLNKSGTGREYLVLQNVQNVLSIEDGIWKYISPSKATPYSKFTNTEFGNLNQDQLYNLSTDCGEKNNVAQQNPQIVEKLKSKLAQIKGN
jgi:arylsulfatase A-like enzyme